MHVSLLIWFAFGLFVIGMIALDLGVFHRHHHIVSPREALTWTSIWVGLALLFCGGIYMLAGLKPAIEFLTGYVVEKSLSVDNVFVFVMVFRYFNIPLLYQHRVLLWGILGALVMRLLLILIGVSLISKYQWLTYLLGIFLIGTGIKMLKNHEVLNIENAWLIRMTKKVLYLHEEDSKGHFFIHKNGKWHATYLFLCLIMIEMTDLMFALDSVPAIFAITLDPFIVYTSNIFALLGLRSLYFLLADAVLKFFYLQTGLAFILSFVGIKMLIKDFYPIPTPLSLSVVISILLVAIVASVIREKQDSKGSKTD